MDIEAQKMQLFFFGGKIETGKFFKILTTNSKLD